jgi:hypothetical protein
MAQLFQGDLAGAAEQFRAVAADAETAHDGLLVANGLAGQGYALAWQGDTSAARAAADATIECASGLGEILAGVGFMALGVAALAAGDADAALNATGAAWQHLGVLRGMAWHVAFNAQAALARGDLIAARRATDEAVATTAGWHLMAALTARARVAIAQGELEQAERDAHDALAIAAEVKAYLGLPDTLECLADVAADTGSHREAARLFGAADGIRQRMGAVRFKVWDAGYDASVAAVRNALGEKDFDAAWAEGTALSTEEAIAYAQRGRGERKHPPAARPR